MPRLSPERSRAQRDRIVDGAVRVFADQGYGPTTVDAICRACGLSKGAVYTYFVSKEQLFLAASEHVFEHRYRVLTDRTARQTAATGVDALVEGFTGTLLQTDGAFLRLWVEGFLLASAIPALADLKRGYHQRFGALLRDTLVAAQTAGALDPELDPEAAAEAVMALADGLMLYTLVPGLGPDAEHVHRMLAGATATTGRQGPSGPGPLGARRPS